MGEVVVKAKKWSREKDIYENRSKSVAYYDVPSEMDDILDKGGYIGEDIHELLVRMNPNFIRRYSGGEEWLQYKGRSPLYVINYKRTEATEINIRPDTGHFAWWLSSLFISTRSYRQDVVMLTSVCLRWM